MVHVAVLGYGVVGSGVVDILNENSVCINDRASDEIKVKKILDIRDFSGSPYAELFTNKPDEIFNDPDINIVVETIGGTSFAYEYTKRALMSGKHVVTSNKELVAAHGPELLKLARENNVRYLFEASVGGGIPIIRPLNHCLSANRIDGITGILNGTTNYILTKMKRDGADFNEALEKAKMNGYAEADPSADIDGHDACRKLAILSSIAFGKFVDYRNIYTEGIANITITDMKYADALDSAIKLLAVCKRTPGGFFCRVSPAIIKKGHPLAMVEDIFNAIMVEGNAVGDAMFYGRGAGKMPTASAVVADIIDIVNHVNGGVKGIWDRNDSLRIVSVEESFTRMFVRLEVQDKCMAQKATADIFGDCEFVKLSDMENEIAFVTPEMAEKDINLKLKELLGSVGIKSVKNSIRVHW